MKHDFVCRYLVFDWGDTLMRDDPSMSGPMYLWPGVQVIEGAERTLRTLASKYVLTVATGAAHSNPDMVRRALARGGLERYISQVFTGRAVGLPKRAPAFWDHVRHSLGATADEVVVVGDSFDTDVLAPVAAGLQAMWFNQWSDEVREGERYGTIFRLDALIPMVAPR